MNQGMKDYSSIMNISKGEQKEDFIEIDPNF